MPGVGLMPIGLGPVGLGTPVTTEAPATGPAGVRYINPATGDYEIDPVTGQQAQMPSIRQRVLLALKTTQQSVSVNGGFGMRMTRKIDGKFRAAHEQSVRDALKQMTDIEKSCRVDAIATVIGKSASATARVQTTVSFTDLTTGKSDQVTG